jgi:hypothetical protein
MRRQIGCLGTLATTLGLCLAPPAWSHDGEHGDGDDEEDPVVRFFLPEVEAHPGQVVEVPFVMESTVPITMVSWSVEYEAGALEFLEPMLHPDIARLLEGRSPDEARFSWYTSPRDDEEEGEGEEGNACLEPLDTASPARGEVEVKIEGRDDEEIEIEIEIEGLPSFTTYEILLSPPAATGGELLGEIRTGSDGEGKLEVEHGDRLPFGARGLADLFGYSLRVRLPAGGDVLAGVVPTVGASLPCEGHEDSHGDQGWLQVSLVTDFQGRVEYSLPAGIPIEVARLRFRVIEGAPEGRIDLKFSIEGEAGFEGEFHDGESVVFNVVRQSGRHSTPDNPFQDSTRTSGLTDGAVLVLSIIGDIGIVMLGDVNLDGAINVSDPVGILNHLFTGAASPRCPAAADANLDGGVDIADPVLILLHLFVDADAWRPQPLGFPAGSGSGEAVPGCP